MPIEALDPMGAAEKIIGQIEKKWKELKTINLMIIGKTGVGKSTLINALFGQKRVSTGIGCPVTSEIERISIPDDHLTIFDTPGLELTGENSFSNLEDQIVKVINDEIDKGTVDDAVHCILYCVSVTSSRFEPHEAEFIKNVQNRIKSHNIPIFIVLTKAISKSDTEILKKHIESLNLKIKAVVPVLAEDYYVDEDYTAKKRGLPELTRLISEAIPESVKSTFDAIQIANLEIKRKNALAVVGSSAAIAAGIGAVPIPFSDAILLVPEQIGMLAGITAVYGVPVEKATLSAILSATVGTGGAVILGKAIVAGLLKLIPGAGSVIGGAISAATAAALTFSLGEAYIFIMTMILKGEISPEFIKTEEGIKEVAKIFMERMKVVRNDDGSPKATE